MPSAFARRGRARLKAPYTSLKLVVNTEKATRCQLDVAEEDTNHHEPGLCDYEPLSTLTLQGHYWVATGDLEYDGEGEPAAVRQREHKMEVLV